MDFSPKTRSSHFRSFFEIEIKAKAIPNVCKIFQDHSSNTFDAV